MQSAGHFLLMSPFVESLVCSVMTAAGNVCFSEGVCVTRVFTTNLCISDWSGNWSDPGHSHYRSLSSVLNLVHSGEKFRSTSSTDTTMHREILFIYTGRTMDDL